MHGLVGQNETYLMDQVKNSLPDEELKGRTFVLKALLGMIRKHLWF